MFRKAPRARSDCLGLAMASFISLLRRDSDNHPMLMFGAIVSAAFIWAFIPGDEAGVRAVRTPAPLEKATLGASTTKMTSRLPVRHDRSACKGQAWAGASVGCLTMIAGANGKTQPRIRLIITGLPTDLNTPNVF